MLATLSQAIEESTERSARTASYFYGKIGQLVADQPDVRMPSRATFCRLFDRLSRGGHVTGSARTRRSLASRPDGEFSQVTANRPGGRMEIDSTPLDILVTFDDGVVGRVELTGMVDRATRTVTAGGLRPATKSVDAALLLTRTVTPERCVQAGSQHCPWPAPCCPMSVLGSDPETSHVTDSLPRDRS
ncbi:hypothetical protein HCN51_42190 [Nonomuraea sp. FMUSA5-5]|uniref:Transposase n=1 Tax=Nonomuraea composti TaxID=2720023 RepID=A0ABX1BL13_9ACTN|nr:hypothetical protein [Nonomuraea sp. FMUSA5-5]NJP95976.1 hypothetical protein [Nonomuraea sp. FMUSA5-5]